MIKILLIEDDEDMCEELRQALEEKKYRVSLALNGSAGMSSVKQNGYNLVLLDLKMPGLNGYELLKHIKKKNPNTKVIVLTGSPISKELLQEEGGGEEEILPTEKNYKNSILKLADGILNKPFDMKRLFSKIKELTD